MPWDKWEDLPDSLKKATERLGAKKRRQWLAVVNKCLEDGGEEGSCIARAWGAVRNTNHALNAEIPVMESGDVPEWVMVGCVGLWEGHPSMREQLITTDHLESALAHFARNYLANGAELPIDYHHASVVVPTGADKAPAAGWICDMELRSGRTELWGRVMWTADTAREIAERKFRYLSPVFQFNAPDRVTGDIVLMSIHSVGLTNTPFLTELESLNAVAAMMARVQAGTVRNPDDGGEEEMGLIETLANALEVEVSALKGKLGFAEDVEEKGIATALVDKFTAEPEKAPAICAAVAEMLGVAPDTSEDDVKVSILKLRAATDLSAVKAVLGLGDDATIESVVNAIAEVQHTKAKADAEVLVNEGIQAGRVPPAQREFFLKNAIQDLEVTRNAINSMPVLTKSPGKGPTTGEDPVSDAEAMVAKSLGVTLETMKAGR